MDNVFAYNPDLKINDYDIFLNDEGYVNGFAATLDDKYDFVGQMSLYPEACEGWYKFVTTSPETKYEDFAKLHEDYNYLHETEWVEDNTAVEERLQSLINKWISEGKSEAEIAELTAQFRAEIQATKDDRNTAKAEIETINQKFQFVVDEDKKAEIIAEREAEAKKPTAQDQLEAQVAWTALLTDTMLPDEEA